MTRHFGVSSRPADGGTQRSGSHSAHDTQRDNVIRFPALTSLPDNSRASERELSILNQDRAARIVLCGIAAFYVVAIGLLLFAGHLIFEFVDLG